MTPAVGTLLTDGSSDRVLKPVLEWLLRHCGCASAVVTWAELRTLPSPPTSLTDRIARAVELYPCEVIFVHRDAEGASLKQRRQEIEEACAEQALPHVCVVPVRMTEAWLLFDEAAIRRAAGNPAGHAPLALPPLREVERLPDPKEQLYEALKTASELAGRRRKSFAPDRAAHDLVSYVESFEPLLQLDAFQRLERDVRDFLAAHRAAEQA